MAKKKQSKKRGKKQAMIKIKALISFAGPHGSFALDNEYEVPKKLGQSWIKAGLAEKASADLFSDEKS